MRHNLQVRDYADDIHLFVRFQPALPESEDREKIVDALLIELNGQGHPPRCYWDKRRLLHARLNTLPPESLGLRVMNWLDQLLQLELREKTITEVDSLLMDSNQSVGGTEIALWQGDITTLKTDAIVNAANDQLLGCFTPLHNCIDNVIHSAAGAQLRDDCNIIMNKQGFPEPTGIAKITRAYNLPAKFVLHTVGPIVGGKVTERNRNDLASAYISCLELCREIDPIRSVAFCCISTGVFGYPADEAAKTALDTVSGWLKNNQGSLDLVVFNVFTDMDRSIYDSLLKGS